MQPDLSAEQHQQQHHADGNLDGCRQAAPSPAGTRRHDQAYAPPAVRTTAWTPRSVWPGLVIWLGLPGKSTVAPAPISASAT
ncbi:MAG TPA: hypothetical protein VGG47_08465 [Acidocella sp.]